MTAPVPTIGRVVHYWLSEQDAEQINRRRADDRVYQSEQPREATGYVRHTGNVVQAGELYPMVITRVWGNQPNSAVNGQVLLDGNDLFWATSVSVGEGPRHFAWPTRTAA